MQIKQLTADQTEDFRNLIEIFKTVFELDGEIPPQQHLHKLLSNPDFLIFVVYIDKQVVGGLSIYVLHRYYSTKPLAYIYDVGIAPAFQGKGLGQALMQEVGNFCKANGFDEMYVEAEEEDTDAVNFYRKTTFSYELLARHFTYSFTADKEE
jgi:aminoglycoside 3-N-acetyltransferase I